MASLRNNDGTRWDWDLGTRELGPCFPRGISWGDLDGEIELNGHFLVVEGKRPQQSILGGQKYAMDARVHNGRVVFIVYGNPPTGIEAIQFYPSPSRIPATWETFWQGCREWSKWAQVTPRPNPHVADFVPSFTLKAAA